MEHLCTSIPRVHILDHCKVDKGITGTQLMLYFSEIETEAERPEGFPQFTRSISIMTQASSYATRSLALQTLDSVFALPFPGKTCSHLRSILSVGMEAGC